MAAAIVLLCSCGDHVPMGSGPQMIHLSADGHGDYPTLVAAVREAPAGSTIVLDPGTYRVRAPLDIFRSLRLEGAGAGATIIESATRGRVLGFSGNGDLELIALTLRHRGGSAQSDPADVVVVRGGQAVLSDCAVVGAVDGRVPTRTAAGIRRLRRGGVGLRALGEARVRLVDCAFTANSIAGVARERGVHITAEGCTGVGLTTSPATGADGDAKSGSTHAETDASTHADKAAANEPYLLPGKRGPLTSHDVALVIDQRIERLLREVHAPGATLAVVRNGAVLYLQGYGFADVERRRPVDPRTTRFRIASLTKLFTATAVMQLWERGRLLLDRSVASYLDLPLPPEKGVRHTTVADLLAHTTGFAERWIGMAAPDDATAPALQRYLREQAPDRILPAGAVSSYSNYNAALAGAVVGYASGARIGSTATAADTAGAAYERWVTTQILEPLGMRHTSFGTPSLDRSGDGAASPAVAWAYDWNGRFVRRAPTRFTAAPAGQLSSTASDMASFMLAHLVGGAVGEARILRPQTVALMHTRGSLNDPRLPGFGHGFVHTRMQNRSVLLHSGEYDGTASLLVLLPGERLGIFVAVNAARPSFCEAVVETLLRHYYPDRDQLDTPRTSRQLRSGLGQYTATYRSLRLPHGSLDKWLAFGPNEELRVTREPGGLLVIDDTRYVQIEPLLFRELYQDGYVAFGRDADGDPALVFRGTATYERLRWYETYVSQRRLVILFATVLGATALAWSLAPLISLVWRVPLWLRRLLAHQPFATRDPQPARAARTLAGLVATADLVFIALAKAFLTTSAIRFGVPAWLTGLLVVPLLTTAGTVVMAGFCVVAWAQRWWTVVGRSLFTLVTLVAGLFIWFLTYWNLLGFRY